MATAIYYSDINRDPVELDCIQPLDTAQFVARWPGLRGKPFDGYQMLVGRGADGQILPVTRCVFRKSNPSNHKCSARCLNAKCTGRGECECECGGRNHGLGMFANPWSVCFDHPDPECRDSIAYIRPSKPVDGFWEANEIATVYACDGSDERKANARLMAAAPDQYAALIEIASAIEDAYENIYQSLPDGVVPDWFIRLEAAAKQARAAIVRATVRATEAQS